MVSGTQGPIPRNSEAQFAEWMAQTDYRIKALEGANGSRLGIVGTPQTLTTGNGPHSGSGTTDFALSNVSVNITRLYKVGIHSEWTMSAGAVWDINLYVDNVLTNTIHHINTSAASGAMDATVLWEPNTGTSDLDIRVALISGGSLTFAGTSVGKRYFWVENIGPRL